MILLVDARADQVTVRVGEGRVALVGSARRGVLREHGVERRLVPAGRSPQSFPQSPDKVVIVSTASWSWYPPLNPAQAAGT